MELFNNEELTEPLPVDAGTEVTGPAAGPVTLDLSDFDKEAPDVEGTPETEKKPEDEAVRINSRAAATIITLTVDALIRVAAKKLLNKNFDGATEREKKDLRAAWEAYIDTLPIQVSPLFALILLNGAVYAPVFLEFNEKPKATPDNPEKEEAKIEIFNPKPKRGRKKKTEHDSKPAFEFDN